MFLRNCWYVAGWSHQVTTGRIVARTIVGESIVLYRTASGAITVLRDRCCLRFAPLSRGRLEGEPAHTTVTSQAVTPITEKSTIYYRSGGQPARETSDEKIRFQKKYPSKLNSLAWLSAKIRR